tara:strand:- start:284 stop:721 length:438 start_codon:yes stop_codon:yes gene_type:complete
MKNEKQPAELDCIERLGLVAVAATDYLHPSTRKSLLEACDAVEAEYDALKAERDALKAEVEWHHRANDLGARQFAALEAELEKRITVAEKITNWAEANYNKSHEASAVVEGCYDTAELEAFGSLAAFKEHAGIRDDYRQDIIDSQ